MSPLETPEPQLRPLYWPVLIMCLAALVAVFGMLGLFTDAYDFGPPKVGWAMTAIGVSFGAFAWAGLKDRWLFGFVLLVLLLGGGGQLWMTEPLWFPSLRLRPDGLYDHIAVGLMAFQGLVAICVLLWTGALNGVYRFIQNFGFVRIIAFLCLCGAFAVSPLGYLSYGGYKLYVGHLIGGAGAILLNLGTIAALLRVPTPGLGQNTFHPLVPATFAMFASAILAWLAFERLPHVEDEVAFLFQARSFAGGALGVPALPEATLPGLEHYLLEVRDGLWFATTPPGWPALLTVGVLIGAPWIINPILAFVAILLAYNIVLRQVDRATAKLVSLLMAASPWYLGTAASLMPHMITLTLTLFAWWALLHSRDQGAKTLRWALLAGLAMGWIFATRQLEALILGSMTGLWLLSLYKENNGMPRVVLYGLGCIIAGSFYLWFNYAMTGDPLLDPLKRYLDENWGAGANGYGFGPDIGPPSGWGALDLAQGHSFFEGLINLINNMTALSIETFGWCAGSLALFWIYVFYARPTRFEIAMLTISALTIAALFFYWFSGSFYIGPRYWFSAFFPLMIFSARGFLILQDKLETLDLSKETTGAVLLALCLFGTFIFTPWRGVEKYHEYGNFHTFPREQKASGNLGNAIIFFDTDTVDYGSAFNENDPWGDETQPLFIRDMGAEINTQVINSMPGRTVVYLKKEN